MFLFVRSRQLCFQPVPIRRNLYRWTWWPLLRMPSWNCETCEISKCITSINFPNRLQSRSQSPRYPCPAERATGTSGIIDFLVTRFLVSSHLHRREPIQEQKTKKETKISWNDPVFFWQIRAYGITEKLHNGPYLLSYFPDSVQNISYLCCCYTDQLPETLEPIDARSYSAGLLIWQKKG